MNKIPTTLKKIITSQHSYILISKFYISILAMILTILLTRIMSPEVFGEYKYYIAIFAILSFFSLPETSKILIKYLPLNRFFLIKTLLSLKLKFSVIASIVFLIFAIYYIINEKVTIALIFFFFGLIFPFYYSYQIFDSILHAQQKFKTLSVHLILRATIQSSLVILIYYLTENILYTLVSYIISYASYNLYAYFKLEESQKSYKKTTNSTNEKKETIILSSISIFAIIAENLDKILIAKYISYEDLAFFTIGILIGRTFYSFIKVYINTYSPQLVKSRVSLKIYMLVFLFGTIVGLCTFFVIDLLVVFLYGEIYINSTIYTKILLLSTGLYALSILYYNSFLYYHKNSVNLVYFHDTVIPIIKIISMTLILTLPIGEQMKLIYLTLIFPISNLLSLIYIKYKRIQINVK